MPPSRQTLALRARSVATLQMLANGLPVGVRYDPDRRAFVVTWTTPDGREAFAGRYDLVATYHAGMRAAWHWTY
jgi:hypothetical protein